jgi:hypothetical protein
LIKATCKIFLPVAFFIPIFKERTKIMAEEQKHEIPPEENKPEETPNEPEKPLTLAELLEQNQEYKTQYEALLGAERQRWQETAEEELTEAQKLEKMTASERQAYQLAQGEKKLAQRMKEFERRQLVVQTGEELTRRGLPSSMAQWLTGADAAATKTNLDAYERDYNAAVQAGINGAMRGRTLPKDPKAPEEVDAFLLGFEGKKLTKRKD